MAAFRYLTQTARRTRTSVFYATRSYRTTAVRFAGREDKLHEEGRAEEIDQHKDDMLKKQKEGKGHWKEELASSSESIVKADRGDVEASDETIGQLQKETAALLSKDRED
ncbi:hypothetical protein LTS18_008702, partial [Coniosporium uncinatum]